MVSAARARRIIMALPDAVAAPHVDREAFRAGGTIFATLRASDGVLNVKLEREVQDMLCGAEPRMFAPVAGGWGRIGWTTVRIADAGETELRSALRSAWTLSRVKRSKLAGKR
jgi:hypothetical protein